MSSTKQKLVDDVHFIFSECARLHGPGKIRDAPFEDIICSLPHPNSKFGRMICGRAAYDRLSELARIAARSARLEKRIAIETILRPLSKILVQRFLSQGRTVDVQQVEKSLGRAVRDARDKCITRTHLVPCHLMLTSDPAKFCVGPVVFHNKLSFRSLVANPVAKFRSSATGTQRTLQRRLLRDALAYYDTFQWVAEVQIENCDADTSARLALEAVTSALDCLHMIFQPRWTNKMTIAGPVVGSDRRGDLALSDSGRLSVSTSSHLASRGQINFEDGWSVVLESSDMQQAFSLCGTALEIAVNPDLQRPLSRRFLDAAQWFGEACRDDTAATKIVKFVTSLERLAMTEERDDITTHLTERIAAICFDPRQPNDREEWRSKVRTAYGLRSKLVHGSISPRDLPLWEGARLCEDVARMALCMGITGFGADGLRLDRISSKRLGSWFTEIIQRADARETSASF